MLKDKNGDNMGLADKIIEKIKSLPESIRIFNLY